MRPELAGVDTAPPGMPQVLEVDAYRRTGMTCTQASCVSNTCGDTGTVRIELAPDPGDSEPVGFRLMVVSGVVPASIAPMIGVDLAGYGPLYLRPTFEEVAALDFTLRAVAIDDAGNESEPTGEFRVQFDGCTLAAVGDACEDEVDPSEDLSAWADGTGVTEEELELESGAAGCTLGNDFGSTRAPSGWEACGFLGLALASVARRR